MNVTPPPAQQPWAADHFEPPAPLQTAVLFLVFNRPDTTAQVFEAIRKARPPRLYVAADGTREQREGEREKVELVRKIATAVDWPCEVQTLFREKNLGCKYAVSGAISWFFDQEEQGIILEDDCLPSQSFFWFCEEILDKYKYNEKVMSICGTNICRGITFDHSYFFSIYALMWGWASWRRAWAHYDLELEQWGTPESARHIKKSVLHKQIEQWTWTKILNKTKAGLIDAWGYQWIYSCWRKNSLTILPSTNLIQNLGFSNDATHTIGYDKVRSNLIPTEIEFPLTHANPIEQNYNADEFISQNWFHASWIDILKTFTLKLPGMKTLNIYRHKILRR